MLEIMLLIAAKDIFGKSDAKSEKPTMVCDSCNHVTHSRKKLQSHVKDAHLPTQGGRFFCFYCDACGKVQRQLKNLISHFRHVHWRVERPRMPNKLCDDCSYISRGAKTETTISMMCLSNCGNCGAPSFQKQSQKSKSKLWYCYGYQCGPISSRVSDALVHCLLTGHDWPILLSMRFQVERNFDSQYSIADLEIRALKQEMEQVRNKSTRSIPDFAPQILQQNPYAPVQELAARNRILYSFKSKVGDYSCIEISEVDPKVKQVSTEVPVISTSTANNKPSQEKEDSPKISVSESEAMNCRKCHKSIQFNITKLSSNRVCNAVSHVKFCCGIQPYVCTGCGLRKSHNPSLALHIRNNCPSARVDLVDKQESEEAIKRGLVTCFPDEKYPWGGFK